MPWTAVTAFRRDQMTDGLLATRVIYATLIFALPLYLLVLTYLRPWSDPGRSSQARAFAIGVAGFGLLVLILVWRKANRPLRGNTPEAVAASFRARMFLCIGRAELPALAAFVGVFVAGSVWIYLVGFAFSLAALGISAPSRARIERDQGALDAAGSHVVLLDALRGTTPAGRPLPAREAPVAPSGPPRFRIGRIVLGAFGFLLALAAVVALFDEGSTGDRVTAAFMAVIFSAGGWFMIRSARAPKP
jgi:hypothetical protein